MPVKKSAKAELNNLSKGIITEASPVNFPIGATRDEQNFELNKDGTRDRRLGMDYESGFQLRLFGVGPSVAYNAYRWKSPGGFADKEFLVSQVGSQIYFYDNTQEAISPNLIIGYDIGTADPTVRFSITSIGKYLVVATGNKELTGFSYENDLISKFTYRLKIRDLFGVDSYYTVDGVSEDITSDERIDYRPPTVTPTHAYNLRNQSWGVARSTGGSNRSDPITLYNAENTAFFPSNSDVVWTGMYNKTSADEVFSGWRCIRSSDGKIPAAKGYFIIDALDRGNSRLEEYTKNQTTHTFSMYGLNGGDLPTDSTPTGASEVTEFAGRVFYTGFTGTVIDGDNKSPDMSTYVIFSRLIRNKSDLGRCYQEGDPTGRGTTDVVDTDGGFIRISGAKNIRNLIALKDAIIVVAENGTWAIKGGSEYGFSATNYKVDKICNFGSIAKFSAVSDGATAFYWSENGISAVAKNQYGEFQWESLTKDTIKRLYESFTVADYSRVTGVYDVYENRIRWLFTEQEYFSDGNVTKELVLDLTLGAFYVFKINTPQGGPEVVAPFNTPSYKVSSLDDSVVVDTDVVYSDTDPVLVATANRTEGLRSVKYMTVVPNGGHVDITFSSYNNPRFRDWETFNGVGVDAEAFMLLGAIVADDTSVHKQVPYLITHFKRTEDGFEVVGDDLVPTKQSSCLIRSQWDWANSINSNKWSPLFQAYRYRRVYIPDNVNDSYDIGFELITTRNKVRGRGRAFSFYAVTEPYKDCRMVGWAISMNGNANV